MYDVASRAMKAMTYESFLIIVSSAEWKREDASSKKSMRPSCGAYLTKKKYITSSVFSADYDRS